jgi:hypothetical protein
MGPFTVRDTSGSDLAALAALTDIELANESSFGSTSIEGELRILEIG